MIFYVRTISKSPKDTEDLAKKFLDGIFSSHSDKVVTVVGLHGDLGSGKTAFTKCIAKLLGINETVTSPTFVIEKIYSLKGQPFERLIHIDAYRLESGKELLHLEWKEICADPKNLILIEWPENVADVMPENYIKINFEFVDEATRKMEF